MKGTVVMLSELAAVQSFLPREFLDGEDVYCCHLCGLAPVNLNKRDRPNPVPTLLTTDEPDPRDPLKRSSYRCRNEKGCDARRRLAGR